MRSNLTYITKISTKLKNYIAFQVLLTINKCPSKELYFVSIDLKNNIFNPLDTATNPK